MPKSNKNKNMRKNRSLKRKINKNKSMRNKRKTNKKNMKGGSEKTRVSKILKGKQGNIFLEGDNGEFNRFNEKTLIDRPTREINRLARQRGYTPRHNTRVTNVGTEHGTFLFPLYDEINTGGKYNVIRAQRQPRKSKERQRQEEQLRHRQLQLQHQQQQQQLQQQRQRKKQLQQRQLQQQQSQERRHQRRHTPGAVLSSHNNRRTKGQKMSDAMRKAYRMPQKGYRYVKAPPIHPNVQKAFNRAQGNTRGPPPGLLKVR